MEDLKPIIAKNIALLRKNAEMTQAELAERLHYSDKAVSKWERGESVPDIAVLKNIADLFGVTVDYLLQEDHAPPEEPPAAETETALVPESAAPLPAKHPKNDHRIIALLSACLVWFVAISVFTLIRIFTPTLPKAWLAFIYAVPATAVVLLVFNALWGKKPHNAVVISVLLWSMLLSLFLSFSAARMWAIFLLGIPGELMVVLWSRLKWR